MIGNEIFGNYTLLETIGIIEGIASAQPNINTIVESGDIYDLNTDHWNKQYAAFCVTQNNHSINDDFITYRFTLFYVDRLVLDKSNTIEIQSTAVQVFDNIIKRLRIDMNADINAGEVHPFTSRFAAECAGAYMNCDITVAKALYCGVLY